MKIIRLACEQIPVPSLFTIFPYPPNILVRAGNKVCSISTRCFPITLTLKYEVN
jgi:hypothetical protein